MKSIGVVLFIVLIAFSGCKKYDEGPAVSIRSKKGRIANTWHLKEIFKNYQPRGLSDRELRTTYTFFKDGRAVREYIDNDNKVHIATGTWILDDDKEYFTLTLTESVWGFSSIDTKRYKILRLKNDEFWWERIASDGDIWEYRLAD